MKAWSGEGDENEKSLYIRHDYTRLIVAHVHLSKIYTIIKDYNARKYTLINKELSNLCTPMHKSPRNAPSQISNTVLQPTLHNKTLIPPPLRPNHPKRLPNMLHMYNLQTIPNLLR